MYRRKASLDHLPIIIIVYTGTSPKYIAIAAPDRIECVPKSPGFSPRRSQPIELAAAFRAFTNSSEVKCSILPFLQIAETGVSQSAPR